MTGSEGQNEEHVTTTGARCAHSKCDCPAQVGNKYCCDVCSGKSADKDIPCECGHPECKSGPIS